MGEFEQFIRMTEKANVIPVVKTLPADLLTPLAVYLKLSAGEERSFLLESVEGGEALGRYSFIGAGPGFVATGNGRSVRIADGQKTITRDISILDFLREHFKGNRLYDDRDLPGFTGGAIGVIDFACAAWIDPGIKPANAGGHQLGNAVFDFYRSVVAFDHVKQLIKVVTLVFSDKCSGDSSRLKEAFENAKQKNDQIVERISSGEMPRSASFSPTSTNSVTSNWTRSEFEAAVTAVKELIYAGDAYQVVLSQCFTKLTNATPIAIYRAVRSLNPSPYMFLIRSPERSVIGASPEMLVRLRGDHIEYRPIAGTRARGNSFAEDAELAAEMRSDSKEIAEHVMLVDLGRNDLGRVAKFGSVKVDGLMSVEKYSHVQHLVSQLSAKLREELDRFDVLASCFPAGTVSGAPKIKAIEIINSLEPSPRGIYAGTVGYFDYAGNMDTCIAIRTLVLENGTAKIQAGAGIVADSVPESEYQETVNKARAMLRAVEIAEANGQ
ncbi:MAG TPA: anthranilate synthase component I family protein [Pyrinomonadaceae bacterium]|nr:anthranilate synthase component I family protein [Pyrinomonadaceae bacterium]